LSFIVVTDKASDQQITYTEDTLRKTFDFRTP